MNQSTAGGTMRGKKKNRDYLSLIPVVRGFLVYLCLIISFGCIILTVQAALEEKRIRYRMAEKNFEKMHLLDELRRTENRIYALENLRRIDTLVRERMPRLGPPLHPAIEIEVPGLLPRGREDWIPQPRIEDTRPITRLRQWWRKAERRLAAWFRLLLD